HDGHARGALFTHELLLLPLQLPVPPLPLLRLPAACVGGLLVLLPLLRRLTTLGEDAGDVLLRHAEAAHVIRRQLLLWCMFLLGGHSCCAMGVCLRGKRRNK
ncbi:hypothetical protein DQ04_09381030, partial [Trypanosoma grayi]|uniref:hypothetical protein n=1 Tax=Trypanosoma grayi TaxID=71804 RepID=UPI0004F40BD9